MEAAWTIIDHVCAGCMGRIARSAKQVDGAWLYRCTNCGLEGAGESRGAPKICACNLRIGSGKESAGRVSGLRCVPNPDPRPECPSEIIAREA